MFPPDSVKMRITRPKINPVVVVAAAATDDDDTVCCAVCWQQLCVSCSRFMSVFMVFIENCDRKLILSESSCTQDHGYTTCSMLIITVFKKFNCIFNIR